ncbi:hypothetical protein DUI87_29528 [Hirundo rustica rustica]|uniref:Uncharacterized protein n=2 Tax=Passeriformes TaxID=9126 RepID=A0A3M0IZS1_HIRRU|nr:hypothetical protein DUI87_29528 [Hirundo rustica rustica]
MGQDGRGWDRTGQDGMGQDRTGWDRMGEDGTGQDGTGGAVIGTRGRYHQEHPMVIGVISVFVVFGVISPRPPADLAFSFDANKQQRQLIAELESKNREILQEIQRLRLEHEQASQPTPEKAQQNPTLLAELRLLR